MGSGKTYFVKKFFLDDESRHLVIDGHNEYGGYTRYIPRFLDNYDHLQGEIKVVMKKMVFPNCAKIESKKKPAKPLKLLVIDEADIYMPSRKPLNYALRRAYVNHRHYELSIIAISRRLTDLNTYVADLADFIVIFNLTGYNSLKNIRNINADIDLKELDYYKYEFYVLDRARNAEKFTLDTIPDDYFLRERRSVSADSGAKEVATRQRRYATLAEKEGDYNALRAKETQKPLLKKDYEDEAAIAYAFAEKRREKAETVGAESIDVRTILDDRFGLISAKTASQDRTDDLRKRLRGIGWKFYEGRGVYEGGEEPTFLIHKPVRSTLGNLGAEFNQKTVIYGYHGRSVQIFSATKRVEKVFKKYRFLRDDEHPDNYTEVLGRRFVLE